MAQDKESKVILSYEVSQKSVRDVVRSTEAVKRAQEELARDMGDLGPAANNSVNRLKSAFADMRSDIDRDARATEEFRRELEALDNVHVEPIIEVQQRNASTGSGGGKNATGTNLNSIGKGVGDVGSLFSAVAGVEGIFGSSALSNIGQLGDVGQYLLQLPTIAAPAAIGLGLVTVALTELQRQSELTAARQKETFLAIAKAEDLRASGANTDELQESIRLREQERDSIQAQIDRLKPLLDEFDRANQDVFPGVQTGLREIVDIQRLAREETGGGIGGLRERLDELNTTLFGVNANIEETTALLGDNVGTLNDAKEAASQFIDELEGRFVDGMHSALDALQDVTDLTTRFRLNAAEEARNEFLEEVRLRQGTHVEASKRRQALELENEAIRHSIRALEQSGEQTDIVTAKIREYQNQLRQNGDLIAIINRVLPGLQVAHNAAEALARLREQSHTLAQAVTDLDTALKKRNDAEKALADVIAKSNAAIVKAEQGITEAVAKGEQERRRILTDSDAELRNISEQFSIDQRDAAEDLSDELKRIRDDARFEELNAIGDRDALAAHLAGQQADKEERAAQQQMQKEERLRNRDYQRRIQQLAQTTQRELDILRERNSETIQAARNNLDIARAQYSMEIQERQKALNIALEQYKNFNQILLDYARYIGQQVVIPNTEFISEEEARRRLAGGAYGSTAAASIPQDSIAASSRSYTPRTAASAGGSGGISIPINISGVGMNRRQIIQAVDDRLYESMVREGIQ